MLWIQKIDELTADTTKGAYSLNAMSLTDQQFDYFMNKELANLTQLEIFHNRLTHAALNSLARNPTLQLVKLNLGSNRITDIGLKFLSQANLQQLTTLQLHSNQIGNEGLSHLAKAHCPKLAVLTIGFNQITDQSTRILPKARWPQLAVLSLSGNQLSSSGVKCLVLGDWSEPTEIRAASKTKSKVICATNIDNLRHKFPKLNESCLKEMSMGRSLTIY